MYDYMPEPFLYGYNVYSDKNQFEKDSSIGKSYSSEFYLDFQLGDHARAQMLNNFKMALRDIQDNYQFYFTNINGLSALAKVNSKNGARLKDAKIEIDCNEALDMRITQLLTMYRKIVWDDTYQRWILPDMMRYFGMRIYVSEIRTFHHRHRKNDNSHGERNFSDRDNRARINSSNKPGINDMLSNAAAIGTAVSSTFLGTNSTITNAVNTVSSTMQTANDVYTSLNNALNDMLICNHAINQVMPTLCFECHMCEFDIEDSMEHINSLSSSNKEASKAKLAIKVGNVREKHAFPLNSTLIPNTNGYAITPKDQQKLNRKSKLTGNDADPKAVYEQRRDPNGMLYAGNYVYDEVLNSRNKDENFNRQIENFLDNQIYSVGQGGSMSVTMKRMDPVMRKAYDTMEYNPSSIPQTNAATSLVISALNEARALAGDKSTALNPNNTQKQAIQAVGDALHEAAERIYNNPDLRSLALSEDERNRIAASQFTDFLDRVYQSTATEDDALRQIIEQYRVIQDESYKDIQSRALQEKPNLTSGFSTLN